MAVCTDCYPDELICGGWWDGYYGGDANIQNVRFDVPIFPTGATSYYGEEIYGSMGDSFLDGVRVSCNAYLYDNFGTNAWFITVTVEALD